MKGENEDNQPFNDAMDHMQKHEGTPAPGEGKLPLGIRIIGYVIVGGMVLMILLGLIGNFVFN